MTCKHGVNKKPALKESVRCASLSGETEIHKGMLRPWLEKPDAMLGHAAWRGDRYPHAQKYTLGARCQRLRNSKALVPFRGMHALNTIPSIEYGAANSPPKLRHTVRPNAKGRISKPIFSTPFTNRKAAAELRLLSDLPNVDHLFEWPCR